MDKGVKKTSECFIEKMGLVAQSDGLPRIAGNIMGLMVIEGGPFSFSQLAERLQVSRASISTNTRLLEDLGVIERVAQTGDRQDYFQISENPYGKLLEGVIRRMTKAHELVNATNDALPKKMKDAKGRLNDLSEFYRIFIENSEQSIEKF